MKFDPIILRMVRGDIEIVLSCVLRDHLVVSVLITAPPM